MTEFDTLGRGTFKTALQELFRQPKAITAIFVVLQSLLCMFEAQADWVKILRGDKHATLSGRPVINSQEKQPISRATYWQKTEKNPWRATMERGAGEKTMIGGQAEDKRERGWLWM